MATSVSLEDRRGRPVQHRLCTGLCPDSGDRSTGMWVSGWRVRNHRPHGLVSKTRLPINEH